MNLKERKFTEQVWSFYKLHGRHDLAWRKTTDPYKILVSEVMLQQTQVDRVRDKYTQFLKQFPDVQSLASASLGDVLKLWQGLGYNRRAKKLYECAQEIVGTYKGKFPKTTEELVLLPGIGPYTAGAVCAFAYNQSVVIIETNVRSVYLHHFFADTSLVDDSELRPYIDRTVSSDNPRDWYYALMDYGSYLKKTIGNPNSRSKQYIKQSAFNGSDRQIRGAIIRLLSASGRTRKAVHAALPQFEDIRIDAQLARLQEEGMIAYAERKYILP